MKSRININLESKHKQKVLTQANDYSFNQNKAVLTKLCYAYPDMVENLPAFYRSLIRQTNNAGQIFDEWEQD